jgi:hypothetical protein
MKTIEMPATTVILSRHAIHRGRKRLGWSKAALLREAVRALSEGLQARSVKASWLRAWLSNQCDVSEPCHRVIRAGVVFLFAANEDESSPKLVTLYQVPHALHTSISKCHGFGDKN